LANYTSRVSKPKLEKIEKINAMGLLGLLNLVLITGFGDASSVSLCIVPQLSVSSAVGAGAMLAGGGASVQALIGLELLMDRWFKEKKIKKSDIGPVQVLNDTREDTTWGAREEPSAWKRKGSMDIEVTEVRSNDRHY
jgi:hypothetical protein